MALPEGSHPIPSRTRKLSPPGPMVLQSYLCGRVGRRRILLENPARAIERGFSFSPVKASQFGRSPDVSSWAPPADSALGSVHPNPAFPLVTRSRLGRPAPLAAIRTTVHRAVSLGCPDRPGSAKRSRRVRGSTYPTGWGLVSPRLGRGTELLLGTVGFRGAARALRCLVVQAAASGAASSAG